MKKTIKILVLITIGVVIGRVVEVEFTKVD